MFPIYYFMNRRWRLFLIISRWRILANKRSSIVQSQYFRTFALFWGSPHLHLFLLWVFQVVLEMTLYVEKVKSVTSSIRSVFRVYFLQRHWARNSILQCVSGLNELVTGVNTHCKRTGREAGRSWEQGMWSSRPLSLQRVQKFHNEF